MPKKKASASKKRIAKKAQTLPWSVYFLILTVMLTVYQLLINYGEGISILSPLASAAAATLAILFIGYEAKTRENKLLSILLTALAVVFTYVTASDQSLQSWPAIACGSAAIALALLVFEKYGKK